MNYILNLSNEIGRTNRSEERYAVKSGAFVMFKKSYVFGLFKPCIVKSGTITNMGLLGIGVEYTATTAWSKKFDKMSIVTRDQKILINNIPCKIITDYKVGRLQNGAFVRRCGIEYGALSDFQQFQLSNFMKKFAIYTNNTKSLYKEFA